MKNRYLYATFCKIDAYEGGGSKDFRALMLKLLNDIYYHHKRLLYVSRSSAKFKQVESKWNE